MSKERNPIRIQKEKSRLTTKGGENQVTLRFSFTPQNVRGQLSIIYGVLGETKVVMPEFYIPPSYHSCIRAEEETFPDMQGLRMYTHSFPLCPILLCRETSLYTDHARWPQTTGHSSLDQCWTHVPNWTNQVILRARNGTLRYWSKR